MIRIDRIDIQIIKCLKENARVNASEIGERVNMSVSAVIERMKKLETSGVIRQYTVVLDHKKIGKDVSAFISVSLEHPKHNDKFIDEINKNPEIMECSYVTGDFDFLLKVITSSTDTLTELLNQIKSIPGVSLTRTLVVLSSTKNQFSVLPELKRKD